MDGLMFTSVQSDRNLAIMTKLKNKQNMYNLVTLSKLNSTLYLIAKNLWLTCWRGLASWSSTWWTPLCTPGTIEAAEPEKFFCSSMFQILLESCNTIVSDSPLKHTDELFPLECESFVLTRSRRQPPVLFSSRAVLGISPFYVQKVKYSVRGRTCSVRGAKVEVDGGLVGRG